MNTTNIANDGDDLPSKIAIVGTGHRARFYLNAILENTQYHSKIVLLCDSNQHRRQLFSESIRNQAGGIVIETDPGSFSEAIKRERIDTVIITSIDRTHAKYIVEALYAGCNVICEKPLAVTADQVEDILRTCRETGKHIRLAFNYRYSPRNELFSRMIRLGAVGRVYSIQFEWMLDTVHGADYFRRWHRDKRNSGGLIVHKASHHFDLASWWVQSRPETVMAMGDLFFYGRKNAEERGVSCMPSRGTGSVGDPFSLDLTKNEELSRLYLEAEKEDGYLRDQGVFTDGISIEDDMAALVTFDSGVIMNYHLMAYSSWEGYRVAVNGSRGRLEMEVVEHAMRKSPVAIDHPEIILPADISITESTPPKEGSTLWWRPMWREPVSIAIPNASGGHGGGDPRLLDSLFGKSDLEAMSLRASEVDGAYAALTGIAFNRSLETRRPVKIRSLLNQQLLQADRDTASKLVS